MEQQLKRIGWFSILFTIIYLFLEITFNIGLVDFINSKNTEISTFNKLETLGRILSSVGLSLFLINLIKVNNYKYKIFAFLILAPSLYFTQNYVFNKIVDGMSNESKLAAYSLGVYRNIYINHEDKDGDKDFINVFTSKDEKYNEIVNSMIGVMLYNKDSKDQVDSYIKNFFKLNMSIKNEDLEDVYDKISKVENEDKLNDMWKRYVIESKRYNNYNGFFKQEYHKKFVENIGIEPNLSKDQFISYIKSKNTDSQKIGNIAIVPENKSLGISALYLKDIPENLNKEQWVNYIQNYISKSIENVSYNSDNIDRLPHSKAIINSVIIVPIAIILSLLSILLNIGILFSAISRKISLIWFGLSVIFFVSLMFISNYYSLPKLMNGFIGFEKNYISLLSSYRSKIHNKFINDENPNHEDIIVIKKPVIPDLQKNYDQLDKKFEEFNKMTAEFDKGEQNKDSDLKIDDDKLNDKGYYGEVNKVNPYTNKQ